MKKVIGYYQLFVGVSIILLWGMLYLTDQITELETARIEIGFHIFTEVTMAVVLIISGILYLKASKYFKEVFFIATGMLLYSVFNSSGYYAESGDYVIVILFFILAAVSCYFSFFTVKSIN